MQLAHCHACIMHIIMLQARTFTNPRGLVWGSYPCGPFKMLKWLSALIFAFHFSINV